MTRVTMTTIILVILAGSVLLQSGSTRAQSERSDTSVIISRVPFGKIEAEVGRGVVVERQSVDKRDQRAFIPVSIPNVGDSLVIDKAELIISVSIRPETTLTTAYTISGSEVPETTLISVFATTTSPAIAVFPASVPAESRSAEWSLNWDEMSGEFDVELAVFESVEFREPDFEARVNVTEIVRRWASGELPNRGFVIKALEEDKSALHWVRDARYSGADAKLDIYYSRNPLSEQ